MSFQVARAPGKLVQMVSTQTGAMATGTTIIPVDDTIPQITEGTQFMTRTITPKNAANRLLITVVLYASINEFRFLVAALFVGTTADALAVAENTITSSNLTSTVTFSHEMAAGVTTELTFRVRAGTDTASTTTFNGRAGVRRYGGVAASSITITEFTP